MPASPNTVIGHIVDVQGNLLIATLVEDDQPSLPTYVRHGARKELE